MACVTSTSRGTPALISPPLSAFWEQGSLDLPACGQRRGSSRGPTRPIFISSSSRPSRGGGEIKARVPREEPVTQAMTIETRRAPGGYRPRSVLVSPLVQRGQAQAKASGKGYHSSATRPRPAEPQDGGHRGAQDGVITSAFGSRRPPLVRITCTRCSPSKWPIVGALPAQYLGRGPGTLTLYIGLDTIV